MCAEWAGVYPALMTEFKEDGALNLEATQRHIQSCVDAGVAGFVMLGTLGENTSLYDDEKEAVLTAAVEAAGDLPVLSGVAEFTTDMAIDHVRRAERAGCAGLMVLPCMVYSQDQREAMTHFRGVAAATDLPIMIYNNPATANIDMTPAIVARLAQIPGVDYIKESTMDVTRVRDIIDLAGDKISVFGGIMGFESFVEGAAGWVAVPSNILPAQSARLFALTAEEQDYDAARALYRQMLGVIRLVGGHRYVSASKAALRLLGFEMGAPRAPRLPLPETEMPEVRAALGAAGLLTDRVA